MLDVLDLIVIGGGPSGLAASIYALRGGLKTILIEKLSSGGQMALTEMIENYPGFSGISGMELTRMMEEQAIKFGLRMVNDDVLQVLDAGKVKTVRTREGTHTAKSVIVASGTRPKTLGVKGEESLIGRGISFCATCDGRFFQSKVVCVIGGGDSAIKEALYLSKFASKIYVIHRRDKLRAEKIVQKRALSNPKFEFIWESVIEEIMGDAKVEGVLVRNVRSNEKKRIHVDGVFIYIGMNPNTDFIDVKKDESKYIVTNENLETSMQGVFAAGDCRAKLFRQVATAVGDGALAAFMAERYVERLEDV